MSGTGHQSSADDPDVRTPRHGIGAPGTVPRCETERSVVALFVAHMFPIGHLPVPCSCPQRQLPAPVGEYDRAPGLRFAPHDHPGSDLVTDSDALEAAESRSGSVFFPEARHAEDPLVCSISGGVAACMDPVDPGWSHRFVVRAATPEDGNGAEYSWPPGELFPEGGASCGVPVTLAPGELIDRFGTAEGRVFAPVNTPFTERSLPAALLDSGYHRYRVCAPLPAWRATSAPWFEQPGGGIRLRTTYPTADLLALGYLEDVTWFATPGQAGWSE